MLTEKRPMLPVSWGQCLFDNFRHNQRAMERDQVSDSIPDYAGMFDTHWLAYALLRAPAYMCGVEPSGNNPRITLYLSAGPDDELTNFTFLTGIDFGKSWKAPTGMKQSTQPTLDEP